MFWRKETLFHPIQNLKVVISALNVEPHHYFFIVVKKKGRVSKETGQWNCVPGPHRPSEGWICAKFSPVKL